MALLAGVNQLNRMGQGGTGIGGFSVASTMQNIATGELNTFFTRQMLEPLSGGWAQRWVCRISNSPTIFTPASG